MADSLDLETEVATAIARVWGDDKSDLGQAAILFLPSARAAIAAYNASFKRDLAERGITMEEFGRFLKRGRPT